MLKRKAISEAGPDEAGALHFLNLAEASLQSKRYEEAAGWLAKFPRELLALKPPPFAYRHPYLLGTTLLWRGDSPGALLEAGRALELFQRANPALHLPEQGGLPIFVAENLKKLHKLELSLLGSLDGARPANKSRQRDVLERRVSEISSSLENLNPLAKIHQLTGGALLELGKLDEAEEHLERAATGFRLTDDWGALASTLNKISQLHHTRGDLPLAMQILEQAINCSLKADDRYLQQMLRANLGHCQLLCGIWRPAASLLPQTLAEARKAADFPRYGGALLFWSSLNLLRGRLKESRRALEEAQRIGNEKNLVGILKYGHGYWADLCMAEGRVPEAETHLKMVLEISQNLTPHGGPVAEAWQKLGEVYLMQGEYAKALKSFGTCREQLDKNPEKLVEGALQRGMGICHLQMQQFRPAQNAFKKAFDIFESCGNEWELAKTAVLAVENGAFAAAEIYPRLVWAREVFKKLEHPAWRRRAQALLGRFEPVGVNIPLRMAHQLVEKEKIARALAEANGNVSKAARALGLLRQTLQYKIKRYKIDA